MHNEQQQLRRMPQRLAALNRATMILSRFDSLDEVCHNAIKMGIGELGFDRLRLFLCSPDEPSLLLGTYGTDQKGQVINEQNVILQLQAHDWLMQLANQRDLAFHVVQNDAAVRETVCTCEPPITRKGWVVGAALRRKEEIIGYLIMDNLLSHLAYSEFDGELFNAYAQMIGSLIARRRIAERLEERQAYYHTLLNAIPDIVFVLTTKGVFQNYYKPADNPLYAPPEVFLGKHVSEVMPPPIAERIMNAIDDTLATGDYAAVEYTLSMNNEMRSYDARMIHIGDEQIVALIRDLTEHKRLEEQLSMWQKMESLGRMAGGIAHDFNNVLAVIQGYSTLARRQIHADQPKVDRALTKIANATEKGAHLTHQLLSFARKQMVVPQLVDVREMIRGMEEMIRQILGYNIVLQIQMPESPMLIKIDPVQLEQIMLNLTTNARDAMSQGGTFALSCQQVYVGQAEAKRRLNAQVGPYVMLEVKDTGTGISAELIKNIFEPFFTTKSSGNGSGLGLAICHGIVQQCGGHILVESTVSVGTSFQIFLPNISNAEVTPVAQVPLSTTMVGNETILLVEDDHNVCKVATDILTEYGYTVLPHTYGGDALQCIDEYSGKIHLLITDVMMPQMNGHEVAEAVFLHHPHIPLLMVSGYVEEVPKQFIKMPNVEFLAKPYKADELVARVRTILDQQPITRDRL